MDAVGRSLEELYERRYGAFLRTSATLVGSSDAAHDVVQDAFAAAYAGRDRYRGQGSLEAWVWRIVLRHAQAHRRRALRDDTVGLDPQVLDPERELGLADAVRRLAPRRRLLVFLHYYADLPYAEVAAIAGVAEGTVSATLAQARRELLQALTEEAAR